MTGGKPPAPELAALYAKLFPLLREKCRRVLEDPQEAQDVAQETFVRLWRSSIRLDRLDEALRWSYRTSTHLAVDVLRARNRRDALASAEAQAPSPDAPLDARRLLERLAHQLPAEELEVAVLARIDGLTQPQIAEVLGCADRTVRRRLERFDHHLAEWKESQR